LIPPDHRCTFCEPRQASGVPARREGRSHEESEERKEGRGEEERASTCIIWKYFRNLESFFAIAWSCWGTAATSAAGIEDVEVSVVDRGRGGRSIPSALSFSSLVLIGRLNNSEAFSSLPDSELGRGGGQEERGTSRAHFPFWASQTNPIWEIFGNVTVAISSLLDALQGEGNPLSTEALRVVGLTTHGARDQLVAYVVGTWETNPTVTLRRALRKSGDAMVMGLCFATNKFHVQILNL
jgi:hypothetical protein